MMSLVGWLCVLLLSVSAQSGPLYKKVGDEVVLQPGTPSAPVKSILWKVGPHLAMQWEGQDTESYRQFQDRGRLNNKTGELTIIRLTLADSGTYTAEIDNVVGPPIHLLVISPVPTPTVTKTCNDEKTSCILSCDGNTINAEPFTYKWKSDDKVLTDSSKEQRITKEGDSSIKEFSCLLENPVSVESSQPIPNPLTAETETPEESAESLKISTGLTVFISLLTAVVLLVLIHRWKAGMWFFQKESMPWEADFWTKDERQPRDAAESNGTTALQAKEQTEEETPMA